jgi:hypothetical protein
MLHRRNGIGFSRHYSPAQYFRFFFFFFFFFIVFGLGGGSANISTGSSGLTRGQQ